MNQSDNNWIGQIPESWNIKPIRYLAEIVQGSTPNTDNWDYWTDSTNGITWVTPADMADDGALTDSNRKITIQGYASCGTRMLPIGTTVISTRAPIGKVNYTTVELCTNQGCKSLIGNGVDQRYLYWAVLASKSELVDAGRGTTFMELSAVSLGRIVLPVPPISEQRQIARVLDEVVGHIDKLDNDITRQLDVLTDYRKSLIQEVVTHGLDPDVEMRSSGVDWIGDIPAHWHVTKLKGLVRHFESGTSVRAATYPAIVGEPGVLSLSAVFHGRFNPHANKAVGEDERARLSGRVRKGTLLVSRCNTSEWVGTPALVDKDCENLYLPDKIWQIDCSSTLINRYVYYALSAPTSRAYCWMMSVGASESMQNIASADLLNVSIAIPEDAKEILQVVDYLDAKTSAIDHIVDAKRKQVANLREQRQSIIYEYVTGKRRIV